MTEDLANKNFLEVFKKEYSKDRFDPDETMLWIRKNIQNFMCWGVENVIKLRNENDEYTGLIFDVNGLVHKGKVLITLAYNDTYTIRLINTELNIVKELNTIYCDQLNEVIDYNVESKNQKPC
jgi:hypothetical protein